MPVTNESSAPYAPAATVLSIVERYRNKGLPVPVDADVLARASVSESLIPRVLHSLRALDLIDERGMPTQVFEAIRLAPEAEYKPTVAKWLEATYADVLQFIDPATADEAKLRDAFRNYQPQGQQGRMITLFSGLFRAAGIGPEKATAAAPRKKGGNGGPKIRPTPPRGPDTPRQPRVASATGYASASGLPPALAGLLASLPLDGSGWTAPDRQRFLTAFAAVLDFTVPLLKAPRAGDPAPEPDQFDEDADAPV